MCSKLFNCTLSWKNWVKYKKLGHKKYLEENVHVLLILSEFGNNNNMFQVKSLKAEQIFGMNRKLMCENQKTNVYL